VTERSSVRRRRTTTGRRPSERAASRAAPAATRARLLAAAGRLFAERGFEGVSVRDVCKAAKANVAAVQYHFGGKRGLHLQALREALSGLKARAEPHLRRDALDPAVRLSARLDGFAAAMLGADADADAPRLILRELARPSAALKRVADEFMRPNFEELRADVAALAGRRVGAERITLLALGAVALFVHCRNAAPVVRAVLGFRESYPPSFVSTLARHAYEQTLRGLGRDDLLSKGGVA
jgi:TetR/AcrR family transcriptional regulator, regulator of cefoperazone and chloramphenicol sensitivity